MKNYSQLVFTFFMVVASQSLPASAATETPATDIGTRARDVFAAKCTGCHGSDLVNPRGRFGYVLDLQRVAQNPEMVIPGEPAESELWSLVSHSEMPPPDSPRGPLNDAQKEVIKQWIEAGAPDVAPPTAATNTFDSLAQSPPEQIDTDRFLHWLGKFHLVVLHFPIALVLAAAFGELAAIWQHRQRMSPSVLFCLRLAALAAIPTAALGWLLAAAISPTNPSVLLTAHRWMGTLTTLAIVATAAYAERHAARRPKPRTLQLMLAATVILVAVTAHFGGLLTHGADFFAY